MPHQLPVFKLNQFGQSLLEMVVLVGLALVIVTGLTIVTVNGLRNSQFSQNQSQATRLAQEAIDCVRTLRDKNLPITISADPGSPYRWYDQETYPSQIWSRAISTPGINFSITASGGNNCAGLQSTATNDTSLGTSFSGTFLRTINLVDYSGANQKKITATTSWTDFSGTHRSQLVTILSKY